MTIHRFPAYLFACLGLLLFVAVAQAEDVHFNDLVRDIDQSPGLQQAEYEYQALLRSVENAAYWGDTTVSADS